MRERLEKLKRMLRESVNQDESGQALVEYAMIILLVGVACVASLIALGDATVGQLWGPIQSVLVPVLAM